MHRGKPIKREEHSYAGVQFLMLIAGLSLVLLLVGPFLLRALDTNGDNLPDDWEASYGITTNAYASTNLVGWWQMESNSTNGVLDNSTNRLNGILTNFSTSPFVTGLFSNALAFSTNGQVNFPTNAALNATTNKFTFSAWFQSTNNVSHAATIADWSDGAGKGWSVGATTNGVANVTFYDGTTAQVVTGTNSPVNLYDGSWHHVATTYATNHVATVYVDGEGEVTNTITGYAPGPVTSFTFGVPDTSSTNNPYIVDEVRLYNRALGAQEVLQLPATYSDLNGTGLSTFQDYVEGLNPFATDSIVTSGFLSSGLTGYYSGAPTLTKTGGDGQSLAASTFATNPLVVQVKNGSGAPLAGAPVTFSIPSGSDGGVSLTSSGTTTTSLSMTTDGSGYATVYYESGPEVLQNNTIMATAVTSTGSVSVSFIEYCGLQSGLALWLRADAGVTLSGTNVCEWTDQSQNSNNAYQATGTLQPALTSNSANGEPGITFNGSGQFLRISDNSSLKPSSAMTIIVAVKPGNNSGGGSIFYRPYRGDGSWNQPWVTYSMAIDSSNKLFSQIATPYTPWNSTLSASGPVDTRNAYVAMQVYDGSTQSFYLNGALDSSASVSGGIDYSGGSTVDMAIGVQNPYSPATPYTGDVSEILVYNRALNSTERQQVRVYLADKYGTYDPDATWPSSYSSDVQAEITLHQWTKAQADNYVALQADNPTMLTGGLMAWFKADSGVTQSSGNVSAWADQTGNFTVTQSTSGDRPTYVSSDVNGKPALRFNGSQWLANTANLGLNSDLTIVQVSSTTNPTTLLEDSVWLGSAGVGQNRALGYYTGSQYFDTNGIGAAGTSSPRANLFVTEIASLNSTRTSVTLYRNGVSTGTGSLSGVQDLTAGITVGAVSGGSFPWQGDIAEVLVYDHDLTSTEIEQIDGYLADKYGIYDSNATWPSAYSSDVQTLITANKWTQAEADAYVALAATSPAIPISGLALWLEADAGVTLSGSNVSAWADQSPFGNNATQSSSGNQPAVISNALNGKPALSFNGASFMAIADNPSLRSGNVTVLTVIIPESVTDYTAILSKPYRNDATWSPPFCGYSMELNPSGSPYFQYSVAASLTATSSPPAVVSGTPYILASSYDGTMGTIMENGANQQTSTTSGTLDYGDSSRKDLTLGADSSAYAIDTYNGQIAEVLIYNRALTSTEVEQADGYLADKYGLFDPNASWPLAYSSDVQAEITAHQWNKAEADAYAAVQSDTSGVVTTGLTLWFKADAGITQDGSGNVSGWTDQAGNYTVTQTGTVRPTFIASDLNGKPAVRFNGSQWLLNSTNLGPGLNQDMTIIRVANTTNTSAQQYALWISGGGGIGRSSGYISGMQDFDFSGFAALGTAATTDFVADMYTLNSSRTEVDFYSNGTETGTDTVSGVQDIASGITVGGYTGGGYGWQGDIAEVLVYDHKLTSTEMQQVSVYLANKYNLPYYGFDAPTISPSGGTYSGSQSVTISGPASPAVIKYTLDGTQPTIYSATYTGPFTLTGSALVQTAAFLSGQIASPTASEQFTFGGSNLPTVPTSLTENVVSGHEIDLSWTLSGQLNYSEVNVYRSSAGGTTYQLIASLDPATTSYKDWSVQSGGSYQYYVGTLNSSGESDTSASTSVTATASGTMTISVSAPSGATLLP